MGRSHSTYCRICEAACGLVAQLDDHGQLVTLRPDRDHPTSRGYACAKGTRFAEVARHPERLLAPRVDGRETTWNAAIERTATRLGAVIRDHGPHAIGIYFGNPMAFNALGIAAVLGFARAIGTRNLFNAASQDCNNKFAGAMLVHGSEVVHPIPDFASTDLAIVFGSNPYVSQSSFVHLEGGSARVFDGILKRGGAVVWVDPRRTESARRWGEHLPIVPGTDAWLLLALVHRVSDRKPLPARLACNPKVEGLDDLLAAARSISVDEASARTGIPGDEIEALADRIVAAKSVALHMSVGVNQGGSGTLAYVLLQALAYVTGNFDSPGGLLFSPWHGLLDRLYGWMNPGRPARSRIGDFPAVLGSLPAGVLADEILTPGADRIRAMLVISGDPLRSVPGASRLQEAFASLDFMASIDLFENETAQHAEVLMPAASWLERWDVALASIPFQQTPLVQVSGPVTEPAGQCRTDAKIISALAIAMKLPGLRWRVGARGLDRMLPRPKFGLRGLSGRPGRFVQRRRLRFWDPALQDAVARLEAATPDPEGYVLIGRRRRLGHNSWLHGGVRDGDPEPRAWMRRRDMDALGIADGDRVDVTLGDNTLCLPVRAADGIAPRTIVVPHGVPGLNVNALIPAGAPNLEPVSGQLVMTGLRVRLQPAARVMPRKDRPGMAVAPGE